MQQLHSHHFRLDSIVENNLGVVDEVEVRQKRSLVVLAVDMLVVCWWGIKPQFAIPQERIQRR